MKRIPFLLILLVQLLIGCRPNDVPSFEASADNAVEFSTLLYLRDDDSVSICTIRDPWNHQQAVCRYLLVPGSWSEGQVTDYVGRNDACQGYTVLRVPLQRNTLTAACHAWLLAELDALDRVAVMCDTAYVKADTLHSWLRVSHVADGGSSMAPNREVILAQHSDAIWLSPYEDEASGASTRWPMDQIYCADYLETSPLGRAEWMKFYGRLVGRRAEADSLFEVVRQSYLSLLSQPVNDSLSLLAEVPYGSTWYVPGGNSTAALLYRDAGYVYPWRDDANAGSLALSLEAVMARAQDCDRWIFKYNDPSRDWTLSDFMQQNPAFAHFRATRQGEVWACNTAKSDFFDVTPFRPDTLLRSLRRMDGAFFRRLNR